MVADQDDPIDGSGNDKEDDTRSKDIVGDEEDGDGDNDDDYEVIVLPARHLY